MRKYKCSICHDIGMIKTCVTWGEWREYIHEGKCVSIRQPIDDEWRYEDCPNKCEFTAKKVVEDIADNI